VLTVANWLRDNEAIDPGACVPKKDWLDDLKAYWVAATGAVTVPKPYRPRHTVAEMRKILEAARAVEPRLFLVLAIGAELRSGQVRRTRRSDVDLTPTEKAPLGRVSVPGSGKKAGETVFLTKGQRAALDEALGPDGYLREYEAAYKDGRLADYQLVPGGRLRARVGGSSWTKKAVSDYAPLPESLAPAGGIYPVRRVKVYPYVTTPVMSRWFREAEAKAGVAHVERRAFYGLRRVAVDAVMEETTDPRTLQHVGGWSGIEVPTRIYRDEADESSRAEAARVRAKLRGEEPSE
jgi:integrase